MTNDYSYSVLAYQQRSVNWHVFIRLIGVSPLYDKRLHIRANPNYDFGFSAAPINQRIHWYCRKVGDDETGTTGILPVAAGTGTTGILPVGNLPRNGRDARCPSFPSLTPSLTPTGGTPVAPVVCDMSSPIMRQYQTI